MKVQLPQFDHRLGRNINHDPRSRLFPVHVADVVLKSVKHERYVPVFDQGNLGSCTGNAGVGCLATGQFKDQWDRGQKTYSLDENGAVQLYSRATQEDPYEGAYPPNDTGSDGLTIAKVLTEAGEISGYQHAFSLDEALKALTLSAFITGTNWYHAMFTPDPDGRVHLSGALAGGHEYVADELDVEHQRVWFTNSWSADWGVSGRFYLTFKDYGTLLAQNGDVTVFVSADRPAPTPEPPAPVEDQRDIVLAQALRTWLTDKGL